MTSHEEKHQRDATTHHEEATEAVEAGAAAQTEREKFVRRSVVIAGGAVLLVLLVVILTGYLASEVRTIRAVRDALADHEEATQEFQKEQRMAIAELLESHDKATLDELESLVRRIRQLEKELRRAGIPIPEDSSGGGGGAPSEDKGPPGMDPPRGPGPNQSQDRRQDQGRRPAS